MKTPLGIGPMLCALGFALAGCASTGAGPGTHLNAAQCRDLSELRNNAPLTRQRNGSELAALEEAGYDPARRFDPDYPADLQAAQRQVDYWYRTECPQAQQPR